MRIGEICFLTNDVVRLANFYKQLLRVDNHSDDEVHQMVLGGDVQLAVYNDGSRKNNQNQNMCVAFTVDDVEAEYERLLQMGAEIIEKPTARPWGAVNMSFYDPDRNVIYLRSFPAER